jgi:Zn2+/Cd2+-exporting ATPase
VSNPAPPRRHFRVHGLDCAEEVSALRSAVGPVVGGAERIEFDLVNGRMSVAAAPAEVPDDAILAAVGRAGLRGEPWTERPAGPEPPTRHSGTVVASAALCLAGFVVQAAAGDVASVLYEEEGHGHVLPSAAKVLYGLSVLPAWRHVLPKAWSALRRLRPDMNLLMSLAVIGAVLIGEWLEASVVAFLFALSLALESWSIGRARRAVAAVLTLAPPLVHLRGPDGSTRDARPDAVPVGALFVVRPGERIPLDGTVAEGTSSVDQAPITGESVPVGKSPGAEVFAGSVNGDGVLVVSSTRPAAETTLAHIAKLVTEAHGRRAPAERWVDAFAARYTPAVLVLAALMFVVPPLAFQAPWQESVYRALSLLVIACPCALVISTPVSVVAAIASAAHEGVLVKGGAHLEALARIRAVAFDKTGTLTQGRPSVVRVVALAGHDDRELMSFAAALEAHNDHPIARAVAEHARSLLVMPAKATDVEAVTGRGVTGRIGGARFWLGSHRYLEELHQETPEVHDLLVAEAAAGRTALFVGDEEHVCGLIFLADAVRPGAAAALRALRAAGVEHCVLLTGDNPVTARNIADEVGVPEVRADLLPQDKVAAVEALTAAYERVAMVGDGVNDAPALAASSVGIAMGAAGSDTALETADVALMSDDLSRLPWLVVHARRTLAVVRQNIAFALAVKAAFVALTLLGHASLWAAIAADMGASLLVILNGLRLLRPKAVTRPSAPPGTSVSAAPAPR